MGRSGRASQSEEEILYPKSLSSAISSRKTLSETSTQATRGHEMAAEDSTRDLKFKPKNRSRNGKEFTWEVSSVVFSVFKVRIND